MTPWEKEFDSDDINAVNRWGETRLYKAAEDGDFELVKSLVERGADISIRTNENTSPRFIARKKKHTEIETFLFAIEQEQLESSKILEEQALKALNASQAVKLEREKKEQEQSLKRKESEFRIWFYSYDLNETIGPVSFEELKQVYSELESDGMMVWSPNQGDWKLASEVIEKSATREVVSDIDIKLEENKFSNKHKAEKKIAQKENNNLSKDRKGFFGKLISGEYGLAKTYWVYGFLVSFVIGILVRMMAPNLIAVIMFIMYLPYQMIVLIGVWRAASLYKGWAIWSYLAYIAAILSWLMIGLAFAVILFGV